MSFSSYRANFIIINLLSGLKILSTIFVSNVMICCLGLFLCFKMAGNQNAFMFSVMILHLSANAFCYFAANLHSAQHVQEKQKQETVNILRTSVCRPRVAEIVTTHQTSVYPAARQFHCLNPMTNASHLQKIKHSNDRNIPPTAEKQYRCILQARTCVGMCIMICIYFNECIQNHKGQH